jgi:TRAP-type C4-dicarboxylate transport system permease small subunit
MRRRSLSLALISSLVWVSPVLAASADLSQVQSFIQSVIQALVTLAGLIAAGFFVVGGIHYITSSGNPEHLDKAKKTILYSAVGLAVAIGAFVLSNIISQLATTAFGH